MSYNFPILAALYCEQQLVPMPLQDEHDPVTNSCERPTITHKIHPTFQSQPSPFPLQFHRDILKCLRGSLMITYPVVIRWLEHRLVKGPGQVSPIRVCDSPHRPNVASESAGLHRSSGMQRLIHRAPVRRLCSVAGGQESKLRIGS